MRNLSVNQKIVYRLRHEQQVFSVISVFASGHHLNSRVQTRISHLIKNKMRRFLISSFFSDWSEKFELKLTKAEDPNRSLLSEATHKDFSRKKKNIRRRSGVELCSLTGVDGKKIQSSTQIRRNNSASLFSASPIPAGYLIDEVNSVVMWYLGTAWCKWDKERQDRLVIQKTLKESVGSYREADFCVPISQWSNW